MKKVICIDDSTTPISVEFGEVYIVLETSKNGKMIRIHRGRLNTVVESKYFEEFAYPREHTPRHAQRCVICSVNGCADLACITCAKIIFYSRTAYAKEATKTARADMIRGQIAYFDTNLQQKGDPNTIVSWNVTKRLMQWVQ